MELVTGFIISRNRYISPEQVPIQYGGLSVDFCECNPEFTVEDPATEITVKPATKQTVEIIVNEVPYEACLSFAKLVEFERIIQGQ